MKNYYILGGDTYKAADMALTTLVVDVPVKKTGTYDIGSGVDLKTVGRPLISMTNSFKESVKVESIPLAKLQKAYKSSQSVFGFTRLLTASSSSEFKRILATTKANEVFVVVGEVYNVKDDASAHYNIQDRAGYEIVRVVRNAKGCNVGCAFKSVEAFAAWEKENKGGKRICANASVDRGGSMAGATIRFKDGEHSGVFMLLGKFKEKAEKVEVVETKTTVKTEVKTATKSAESDPFTKEQRAELNLGKEHGIDYKSYENPAISAARMKRLRHLMERNYLGIPALCQSTPGMSDMVFDTYCRLAETNDITPYVYDKIDVGGVYTLYYAFANTGDEGLLGRAKKLAGKGIITREIAEKATKDKI